MISVRVVRVRFSIQLDLTGNGSFTHEFTDIISVISVSLFVPGKKQEALTDFKNAFRLKTGFLKALESGKWNG